MIESLVMAGVVWLIHAVAGGLPAIVFGLRGWPFRWTYCLLLIALPFWALLPAQVLWPVGGMSSYLTRILVLTAIVFIATLIEVFANRRKTPVWIHPLLLVASVLAVVPIQFVVPPLPD
jgi:hypothetical protein